MAATHAKEAAFMHASSVSTAFMHSPGTSKPAPINDASEMEEALPPVDENTPLLLQLPPAEDWNLELRDWDSEDGDGGAPRTLGVLPLCGIIYFAVSGGPEGTEGLVRTGGPAGALVGLAVTALVWSLPIALLSTELATTVPQNGGPMVWSRAAWGAGTAGGDAIAFLAGWMSFLSTAVDAALYPSMFVSYLDAGFSLGMSDETQLWVKICFVVVLTAQNMGGAAAVGDSSVVMIVILLGPFVAFIFAAFGDLLSSPLHPANWFEAEPTTGQTEYLLLLLWNMGMWEAAASCAGEVKNPGYTFPRALALVMLLVFANYALPIMAFTGLDGDSAKYTNGYYITVAGKFGGAAFATAMAIGQSVSTMGLFTNGLVKNSFSLCGMAEQTLLPRPFSSRWERTSAPWVSILASAFVTTLMVCADNFSAVLGVDILLYGLVLLTEIAAFLKLRWEYPELERGYKIPLEGFWVLLFFLPCVGLCFIIVAATPWDSMAVAAVFIAVGFLLYGSIFLARVYSPDTFEQAATDVPELLETPALSRLNTPGPSQRNTPLNRSQRETPQMSMIGSPRSSISVKSSASVNQADYDFIDGM
mmetsp:Transcript_61783/g.145644  ORF Transcript_61783/g.145644 Transcript_61783/m.145644 type:complete len:588 (-) Transcript_61783:396-2159(-)